MVAIKGRGEGKGGIEWRWSKVKVTWQHRCHPRRPLQESKKRRHTGKKTIWANPILKHNTTTEEDGVARFIVFVLRTGCLLKKTEAAAERGNTHMKISVVCAPQSPLGNDSKAKLSLYAAT